MNLKKAKVYALGAWVLVAVLLGATWAVNSGSTTVSVSTTAGMSTLATVTSATVTPSWSPIVGAVGSITGGNLYNFTVPDTSTYAVTLFLPNVYNLVHGYSYLNMNITVFTKSQTAAENTWTYTSDKRASSTGSDTAYLTLANGQVILYVSGSRYYVVRLVSGVFYCTSSSSTYLTPSYYVEVSQA